ncbi:MAG TPA: hypothetical protein HPP77_07395 [Candidatus Hydrogenedentes bacterium]|nr:hypothetical protein [Candidatus Hydrogenedentota bacterium]
MKWVWRILVVLAALILFLAFVLVFLAERAEDRLDAFLAELEEEGVALDVADLVSSRPEGTEFYAGPIDESATAFLLSQEAGVMPRGASTSVDVTSWPFHEASMKAGNVFHLTPDEEAEVREAVRESHDVIDRLKEVSALPPTSIEDIVVLTGMDQSLFTARIPNLLACRAFVNLLILDAYVAYREGRPDDALETCGHILQFVGHIRDVPTLIASLMMPNFKRSAEAQATHEVRLAHAKIALALNRYKRDHGVCPEHLVDLVPDYLTAVPIDVFSGKEMLYRKQNGAYLLYSTGPDGIDNLKTVEQEEGIALQVGDDIVWGVRE